MHQSCEAANCRMLFFAVGGFIFFFGNKFIKRDEARTSTRSSNHLSVFQLPESKGTILAHEKQVLTKKFKKQYQFWQTDSWQGAQNRRLSERGLRFRLGMRPVGAQSRPFIFIPRRRLWCKCRARCALFNYFCEKKLCIAEADLFT